MTNNTVGEPHKDKIVPLMKAQIKIRKVAGDIEQNRARASHRKQPIEERIGEVRRVISTFQ